MTTVVQQRWATRQLVGDKQHAQVVRVRPGHMTRGYLDTRRIDDLGPDGLGSPIFPPLIWQGQNHHCWKGEWVPTGPWVTLPSVQSTKWSRSFDVQTGGQQGTSTLTVVMDNIAFPEASGITGLYHTIARGYYSPLRGNTPHGRTNPWPHDTANAWENVLDAGYQIELWEGYGSGSDIQLRTSLYYTGVGTTGMQTYAPPSGALDRTWTGIVIDCELESHPDQITITAQDFGIFLTDERLLGGNKALEIRSPVTFADRRTVQGEDTITGPYHVSSGVINQDGAWVNAGSGTQWIELDLPAGTYSDFYVAPASSGQTMYVSLKMGSQTGALDRAHPLPANQWVDLNAPALVSVIGASPSAGTTPGSGIPYMFSVQNLPESPARRWYLGHTMDINGTGGKLRLTFTGGGDLTHLYAYHYHSDPATQPGLGVTAKGWILVDDAAEVVRMLLIWAGFAEWNVEDFLWSLYKPMLYGEDKFFMDVINDMLQQGAFIFYMAPPSNDDRSLGSPHFEHMHAIDAQAATPVLEVRDTDMVEALTVKTDLSNLPYFLRYRGTFANNGVTAGQDLSKRIEAIYYPPWSGAYNQTPIGGISFGAVGNLGAYGVEPPLTERIAGIHRHFTETMALTLPVALTTTDECLFAGILAAINYALNMRTGQFQIPGLSRLKLNDTISIVEESTATNSRMWVTGIESEHVNGGADTQGHWTMTISGSMVDNPDMYVLIFDHNWTWKQVQAHRGGW